MNLITKRKIYLIIVEILCILSIICRLIEERPIISCFIVIITALLYSFKLIPGDEKDDALKNRALLFMSGLVKFGFLFGAHIEYYFKGLRTAPFIVDCAFVVVTLLIEVLKYSKDPYAKKFKFMILFIFEYMFVFGAMTMEAPWLMYMSFPLFVAYLVYFDVKLLVIGSIFINIFNVIGVWRYISQSVNLNNFRYMRMAYFIQMIYVVLFTVSICYILYLNNKFNNEKLEKITKMHNKANKLSKEVIDLAQIVRSHAVDTNEVLSELENATNNSLHVLKDISNGNIANAKSVESQTDMSVSITSMITNVESETNMVSTITNEALSTIVTSKKLFNILKNKSNSIEHDNKEVIQTINDFVENARRVKNITNGIAEISEQTNLLSLNASIESARAGEAGKGFAVVAGEIRTLADATSNLTNDIDKIVQILENNAIKAQKVVNDVVKDINDENVTIDMTLDEFLNMENLIKGLEKNIDNILNIVTNMSDFNAQIINHIMNLSASSEEVAACTEEAVEINNQNMKKAQKTRTLMDELLQSANRIDEFIDE